MENLKIAYIQADLIEENVKQNLEKFDTYIRTLTNPVDLIVLPEMFNTSFCVKAIKPLAENMTGHTVSWMAQKAKETNAVIAGSLVILENDKYVNRFVWMRPDGTYGFYDKKHLFLLSDEARELSKGEELKTFELKGWRIRPFICYDLRFPCWIRNRYKENKYEYDLAIFVASWPVQRSHVWRSLLTARALENQCYVLGVNRVGIDGINDVHIGDSMIVDAYGNIASSAMQGIDCMTIAEINLTNLFEFRKKFNVAKDWDNFQLLP